MKLRHAAVLALIGWYLMMPPLNSTGKVDTNAPLSKWNQLAVYDSAPACQKVLFALQDAREQKPTTLDEWREIRDSAIRSGKRFPFDRKEADRVFSESRCVATDDPRLKEK